MRKGWVFGPQGMGLAVKSSDIVLLARVRASHLGLEASIVALPWDPPYPRNPKS